MASAEAYIQQLNNKFEHIRVLVPSSREEMNEAGIRNHFIDPELGLFISGCISFISIISLIIGFEINSWGVVGGISSVGINGLDSFFLAVPFLIIGMIGLIIGLPSFMVFILNSRKSLNKND